MRIEEYPKITAILRGYSYAEALFIIEALTKVNCKMAVEVTANSDRFLEVVKEAKRRFANKILIGVGTVRTIDEAKNSISNGASFILGPNVFSENIIRYAKENNVITIPGAMTPSEIESMFDLDVNIVKVFPASVLGIDYFNRLKGPYGDMNLMAVGGINRNNIKAFQDAGVRYFGIGSSLFEKKFVKDLNEEKIIESVNDYIGLLEEK